MVYLAKPALSRFSNALKINALSFQFHSFRCDIADLSRSADKDIDSKISTNVLVSSDGTCLWSPPGLFQSSCPMDISWFPFDDQICAMKFGSWMYNGFQLNLRLQGDNIDINDYFENNEWLLVGTSTVFLSTSHFIMEFLYLTMKRERYT